MFIHQVIDKDNGKINKKHRETPVRTQSENKDQEYWKKKGKGRDKAHGRIPAHVLLVYLRIRFGFWHRLVALPITIITIVKPS